MRVCQQLRAGRDTNGNPRRLWVVYEIERGLPDRADLVDVIDEGYKGTPKACRGLCQLSVIIITPSEYREWLRVGKELAEVKK